MIQDVVAPVVVNQRDHGKRFPGLSPQRLEGVERAPIPEERKDRPARASERRPRGQGPAHTDRSAGQVQPAVGRRARAGHDCGATASGIDGHDGVVGQHGRQGRPHLPSPQSAVGHLGTAPPLRGRIRQGHAHRPPQPRQRVQHVFMALCKGQHLGPLGGEIAGHTFVGEEAHGGLGAHADNRVHAGEGPLYVFREVGQARQGGQLGPLLYPGREGGGGHRSASFLGQGGGPALTLSGERVPIEQQQGAAPEGGRGCGDGRLRYLGPRRNCHGGPGSGRRPPGAVHGDSQGCDAAQGTGVGPGCRRHGFGAVLSEAMGTSRGAHPSRKGSGDALDIRVQGRIEGSVMAGVIPDEIKQGGARAARVMKIRRGVPQPRA